MELSTSRKRKRREFELDIAENAILEEIDNYFKENEEQDAEYRTALKRFRQELEGDIDEYREKLAENLALRKTLKKLQDDQKATRLSTLELKKERTTVQQDLYELEMSQFVGNQERLALEGLNDFFVDLDVVLEEAKARRPNSPEKEKNPRKRKRSSTKENVLDLSSSIASANFEATVMKAAQATNQILYLRTLADRLEQIEKELSRL